MIATLFLVACQAAGVGAKRGDISGIYYLVEVDGSAVPAEVFHDGVPLQVRSGTFIISEDGTCFSRTRFIPADGDEITREVRAKYRIEDSRLIMRWEGAGMTEGAIEGDTFIMDNEGMIFEYTRSG
jgi:hypothetical protein